LDDFLLIRFFGMPLPILLLFCSYVLTIFV